MQEKNKAVAAAEAKAEESQVGQWDALARNMVRLFDEGTKVLGTLVERRNGSGPYSMASEAGEATKALGEVARQWVSEPGKLAAAQSELFKDYAELWGRSVRRFLGEEDVKPVIEPAPGDNRFKDPDWSNTQFFDFWKQAYLLTARWAEDVTRKTEGVDDKTRKRALFYLEQMLAAFSPSNFAFTNPEVVRATLATNAANLVQGMAHLAHDLEHSKDLLRISQTDLVGIRGRQEFGGHARQGRVPERSHPAHPVQPERRRRCMSGRSSSCRHGSTNITSSISSRRKASSNGRWRKASPSSSSRG